MLAAFRCASAQPRQAAGDSSNAAADYAPVAPPAALVAGIASNFKVVADWLNELDFASAREAIDGVIVLVNAVAHTRLDPQWRDQTGRLRRATGELATHVKDKNAATAADSLKECESILAELRAAAATRAKAAPAGDKPAAKDIRPAAPLPTLMKLLDGTYGDLKAAKTTADQSDLSFTLAEVANIVRLQRGDAAWQGKAAELRDAALRVAASAPNVGLQSTRAELKNVYARCDACHKTFKR